MQVFQYKIEANAIEFINCFCQKIHPLSEEMAGFQMSKGLTQFDFKLTSRITNGYRLKRHAIMAF